MLNETEQYRGTTDDLILEKLNQIYLYFVYFKK